MLDVGRGAIAKDAVIGAKDRTSNRVAAEVIETTDKPTVVAEHVRDGLCRPHPDSISFGC